MYAIFYLVIKMKITASKIGIAASIVSLLLINAGSAFAEDRPYGWSPQTDFSNQGPPTCGNSNPDKAPALLQPNHPILPKKAKGGEVVLYWHKVPGANNYSVYYGFSPKNYIFSAPDVGDTDNLVVRFLPNKIMYFSVQARNGCAAGPLSREWAVRPGSGRYISPVLGTTKTTTLNKKTSSLIEPSSLVYQKTVPEAVDPQVQNAAVAEETYKAPVAQNPAPVTAKAPEKKGLLASIFSLFGGK
jgi:hypothetical protein